MSKKDEVKESTADTEVQVTDDTQVVPATPELQLGEHNGEPQPPAPEPVPATATPDVDQVTTNTHLRKVSSELQSVVKYVEGFLGHHPVSEGVAKALTSVIAVVDEQVK